LFVPGLASAANFTINDTLPNETILVSWDSNFDRGSGFCVNGSCAGAFVSGSSTITESSTSNTTITFTASWLSGGGANGSATFYWLEAGSATVLSDRLTLTWTGPGVGVLGTATISGTFISDSEVTNAGTIDAVCPSQSCHTVAEGSVLDL